MHLSAKLSISFFECVIIFNSMKKKTFYVFQKKLISFEIKLVYKSEQIQKRVRKRAEEKKGKHSYEIGKCELYI